MAKRTRSIYVNVAPTFKKCFAGIFDDKEKALEEAAELNILHEDTAPWRIFEVSSRIIDKTAYAVVRTGHIGLMGGWSANKETTERLLFGLKNEYPGWYVKEIPVI